MKKVSIKKSKIQGKGLFAEEPIKKGETIGVAHQVLNTSNHKLFVPTGIIGKHYNHSKNNPNVENIIDGNKRYLVALKDIKPGTEITSNYFNTPDMEKPKKEWEDKLNEGGEPTDCPEGYYYDAVQGCVPGDEHHKWLREWYANRQMNTPEGQKILKKVQPEILERSTEFPPYVMTEELPKNTPAAYDTEKNVVLLNKFLPEKMLEESKTHENAHYLTSGDKFLNLFDKEIGYVTDQNVIDDPKKINTGNEQWDKNLKENFDYAVSPEEIYSKIMTLRKDAGFDPVKTITMQDLNDYFIKMKDAGTPLNPDIEELKAITKDKQAIVNLLNDLVYQSPTNQDIQITKRGGSIYNKGGSTNDAFQKKLEEVAKRLKVSKSDLLGIMKHESGLNPSAVNPYTRATGLIQFMPSTAKRMGTSVEALKNMSAIEQLDYVEKFYKPIAGKAKDIGDLYMFTFLPAVVGKPDNYVIGSKGSGKSIYGLSQDALYRQNAVFDKDKKGYYTVGDVKARIAKYSTSKGKLKEDGSKTPGIKMETSPLNKDIPIEEYSEIKYNPVEKVEEPVRPKYTLEQAMFEMGAVETPTNTSQMSAALKFLSPKRFNPQPVQTALTEKEIQQYVKGGYIVEELDDYAAGGNPCPEGFQKDLVTGECVQIAPIVQKSPWYPEENVNPAAYVSGYRGGNPRMYKYGFLENDQGNVVGGGGFGFPKPGVHVNALGVIPTSANDRQYFKGAYEAGISKDFKNLNLGLGVGTAITGYPGENGFVRDPIKFQPKLNLRYNFEEGGTLNKFLGGGPTDCGEGMVWDETLQDCIINAPINPDSEPITTYEFESLTPEQIAARDAENLEKEMNTWTDAQWDAYEKAEEIKAKAEAKIKAEEAYNKALINEPQYGDEALNFVKGWHDSPMYNQMVLNSYNGQQKNADYLTKLRKQNIATIPGINIMANQEDATGTALNTSNVAALSRSDTGQVEVFPAGFEYGPSLYVHEYMHSSDRPRELYKYDHPAYYSEGYPSWMLYNDPRFPDEDVWHDRTMPKSDQMYITTHRGSNWKDNETYKLTKEAGTFTPKTDEELKQQVINSGISVDDPKFTENFNKLKKQNVADVKWYQDWYKKNWKEMGHEYVSQPTEVRARLGEIRLHAKKENIYDPYTEQITPEIFQNYINKKREDSNWQPMKPIDELRNEFTDEEILNMLQNISKNPNPQKEEEGAEGIMKYGGGIEIKLTPEEIEEYRKGGYIVEELDDYDNGGEKNKKPVFKLDPNFKLDLEKPLDLPYTPVGGLPFIPKLDLKNINIKTGKPVIPEWVKQKQEEAISKEILKNGMIDATRISRQGGLDKNKIDFIKDQVREELGYPTSIQYKQDKKKVVQNKLDALDVARVNKTPIDLKLFTDSKSDVDFVKTQEQEGWEAMNDLLNEMNNDANVYYDKVKKVSNKDRGDKSNRDLLREDLLNAMGNGTIDNLISNIKDKSGEWQYNQLAKKEAATPWINPLSFSGLGLFDKGTKIGQFTRDFVADPLNVMEELIWDQDYMVNRNEILRDPSHPLHAYYMKRTGMDKSPLSQALQYINPFSSAAESSVAIGKGEYGDAAYQLGEGLAKTVGIAAAVEFAPLLGQYTIPGLSKALPGMTYAQGLNVLGAGYGVTQVPKTFKSIKNAFEKGDKESIRAAVNQTATNALDFLGIGELKNVWNVPEKSIFYLAEDLTDSKNFAKEIKNLKESDVVDDFLYQERLDMWKDAMNQTQAKYADQGFQMKPADVLKNPDAVQYLKSTFEQMKAESIAYLESVEGRASVQKMLDEFPRTKRGKDIPGKYVNKFGEVFENNRADEVKRFIDEANKDPKKFVEEFLVNSEQQLMQAQKELNYLERRKAELTQEYDDFINAGDQAAANSVALDINLMEGRLNDRTRDIAKIKEIEGKISVDNPDFESLFNDPHFMYDRHFEPARTTEAYRKMADDPRYHAVDAATEEFTVDDYINQLATQKYYDETQILNDAKIFEGTEKNRNDLQDLLAKTDPKDPLYQQIKDKIDSLTNQLRDDILGHTGSGNTWYNAFHSGNRFNNNTLIGRGFVPGTETSKPVVIAHEMAHGTPVSWPGFSKKAPWYDVFRSYGSQGSKRMGIHPVDEVLSEIDLFDAPPDFVQYKNMKPWYKGDGVNPYPSTVEEIEIGQGMPFLDYKTAAGQLDVTDAIGIGKNKWNDAKDYFVTGSMGNEKVTFLAEVKQAMLDGGYGKRGNFKMKDLESFWKDYVQQSKKSSYGWDLRLLEIARPTTRTKKYMLKGLNMPGYKKGGSIQLELSDDQIQDYIKQGYVVEESMSTMQDGGKVVSELWTEITGTPWQEAKTRGLTTGTFDQNIALRNRLLAGEFGKINNAVSPKTNYDLSVEELVKKGKTLDDLVNMKVGTRSGLMSRFPELFDEETKNKVEAQLDEEENKNYGLQSKINTNPYSDFGKTKNKIKSSKSNKISVNSIKPYEFSSFDLGSSWKNKMYSDFGKPKKENKSDKKDANNLQNGLGIKVDVSSIKEMKKDPIIKNMIDRMEANNKKPKTIESKPLSGSTMPLGPMALDWSKTDFSKGKNNMIIPLGTPITPLEKLWASIPKSKEEVLETEWGQWGAKKVLDLDILPKSEQEQLRRKLEKEGVVDTPDQIIKLNKKEETKTKFPEVKPKVDKFYQEVATVKDSYDPDNTLLSYRNQWDNNEGFVYYATPVKKDRSENDEYSNVKGVGHFLLDASASKSKPYTHGYNKSLIERAKRNNDYVPVFTPEKDDYVRLKYKRANDLKKDDKVITPLRQMKFDEIDFSQTQQPEGFKKGINEVKKKDGQGTYLLFKERDGYSRFSGGSVVFIFNDNFGNTIVRDFAGSLNQIENEGIQIKRRYGLTDKNLVIGYHDVGSFSAKIKANNDNKLKAKQWEGFNNEDWTGGALLIPQ